MGIAKIASMGFAGLTMAQPVFDYSNARKEGHSVGASIGRGALSYATFELFPGLGFGIMAKDVLQTGVSMYKKGTQETIKSANSTYAHGFGGNFVDTQQAYTMRQRGIQAIQNNGINARTVLGNEARMFQRGRFD